MDHDLTDADNYVVSAVNALDEARSQITQAAAVFIDNVQAREALGEALGRAHNAISRARRDLKRHRGREQRRADRDSAEEYLGTLGLPDDGRSLVQVALLPLPLEDERIPLDRLNDQEFQRNLITWITRFNNEQRLRWGYLMEVPGSMGSRMQGEYLRYSTTVQGGDEPSQEALLYPTGAFVYRQPLWRHSNPPRFFLDYVKEEVRLTLTFATRFFEETQLVPRTIAMQCAIRNATDFELMIPGRFSVPIALKPNVGLTSLLAPAKPLLLSGSLEAMLARALPAIEPAILANYGGTS